MIWLNMVSSVALMIGIAIGAPSNTPESGDMKRLDNAAIVAALRGKLINYMPPGTADTGVHEEFHADGIWRGIRYSRGPMQFSGHWRIRGNQLCAAAKSGLGIGRWKQGPVCRTLWRNGRTGGLWMEHLDSRFGLQQLSIRSLKAF